MESYKPSLQPRGGVKVLFAGNQCHLGGITRCGRRRFVRSTALWLRNVPALNRQRGRVLKAFDQKPAEPFLIGRRTLDINAFAYGRKGLA